MWIDTVFKTKKNRCHSKVTPIISMDGINGHKKSHFCVQRKKSQTYLCYWQGSDCDWNDRYTLFWSVSIKEQRPLSLGWSELNEFLPKNNEVTHGTSVKAEPTEGKIKGKEKQAESLLAKKSYTCVKLNYFPCFQVGQKFSKTPRGF